MMAVDEWEALREDMAANLFDFWAHRERLVGEARERAWKAERRTFLTVVDNQFYYLGNIGVELTVTSSPKDAHDIRADFVILYSKP